MKSATISFLTAIALLASIDLPAQERLTFKIIVHPSNPASSISKAQAKKIFLKKVTNWSDGVKAMPVDLGHSSKVREDFSKEVLRKSITAVKSYWQQQVFSGRCLVGDQDRDVLHELGQPRRYLIQRLRHQPLEVRLVHVDHAPILAARAVARRPRTSRTRPPPPAHPRRPTPAGMIT